MISVYNSKPTLVSVSNFQVYTGEDSYKTIWKVYVQVPPCLRVVYVGVKTTIKSQFLGGVQDILES